MNGSRSLAAWLAATAAFTVAIAMLAYTLSFAPAMSRDSLAREALAHAGHALALAVPIYVCFAWALRRLVVTPLRAIRGHLYGVATHHLTPLLLPSRVLEIEEIVSSVNVMVRRMQLSERRGDVRALARQVKALAGRLDDLDPEESAELLRIAAQLEQFARAAQGEGRDETAALASA